MFIAQVRMFSSKTLGRTENKINEFLRVNAELITVNSFTTITDNSMFCVMIDFEIDTTDLSKLTEVE